MSDTTERADVQRATEWLALVNESPMSNRAKSGPTLRGTVDFLARDVLSLAAALREAEAALEAYGWFDDVISVMADARHPQYAELQKRRAALRASTGRDGTE